jgi:SagB-type dehydrogenase family enzyme
MLVFPREQHGRRELVAETSSYAAPTVINDVRLAWALTLLPGDFTEDEAIALWSRERQLQPIATALWQACIERELVIPHDSPLRSRMRSWSRYGWGEAAFAHWATRDHPFVDMSRPTGPATDRTRMTQYRSEQEPPSIYQEWPTRCSLELPPLPDNEELDAKVAGWTAAQRQGRDGWSLLLTFVFGRRDFQLHPTQKITDIPNLHKTIPSGGARHPTEAFLLTFEGAPFAPGVYHYNVRTNALDLIAQDDPREAAENVTLDLFRRHHPAPPLGLLVLTSRVERAMWRYRDSRSWRAVLIDVGHAMGAVKGLCRELGLGCYPYQKFRDSELVELLGCDPIAQPALYVASLYEFPG